METTCTDSAMPMPVSIPSELVRLPMLAFRVRLEIAPQSASRVPSHQAALVYAMLCDAHGLSNEGARAMPDGVLISTPDQAVRSVDAQHPLSIGLTLLADSLHVGRRRLQTLVDGLRRLGRSPSRQQALGKFQIQRIDDLVSQTPLQSVGAATAVPDQHIADQFQELRAQTSITLRMQMPLRCSHAKNRRREGHRFFDETDFPATTFLSRLRRRLVELGWDAPAAATAEPAQVLDNQLVWLDVGYGSSRDRKTLGGVVGPITLDVPCAWDRLALILGQYVRVGENTRFGFGEYRITGLTHAPAPCPRSASLLARAIAAGDWDAVSQETGLGSGVLRHRLNEIQSPGFTCDPHTQISIRKPDGGQRALSIPSQRDRAVQRGVLPLLADGVDGFLESSSLAYRRGLGRSQALQRIKQAHREGFEWAVKADFLGFFEHVDHALLARRLRAYLADDLTVDWLLRWVHTDQSGAPGGLPTGSPLSPMLANLFLDQFDERVQQQGGRLVRYADDFLVLCRSRESAEQMFAAAQAAAQQLELELNQAKTQLLEPGQGFMFLGFHFQRDERWTAKGGQGPQRLEQLQWVPAKQSTPTTWPQQTLAGESRWDTSSRQSTVILGPDVQRLSRQGQHIVCETSGGGKPSRTPIDRVEHWVIVGRGDVQWAAVEAILQQGSLLSVVDPSGRAVAWLDGHRDCADAVGVLAQAALQSQPSRQLQLAKELIAAKINNYAVLHGAYRQHPSPLTGKMFALAKRIDRAESFSEMLGLEGQAAAIWYGQFESLLGKGFAFPQRVAPAASDPVNVLLNIGHTVLHRWMRHWIQHAQLVPTLGALHENRAGHSTLASDLQEPFRPLIDRAVIEATRVLRPTDFTPDAEGPYPLRIRPRARTKFLEIVYKLLRISVAGQDQPEPLCYLHQARRMTRRYRTCLLKPTESFHAFWHPSKLAAERQKAKRKTETSAPPVDPSGLQ